MNIKLLNYLRIMNLSQRHLAKLLGIGQSSVNQWVHQHKPIPVSRVYQMIKLAAVKGIELHFEDIRGE